MKISDHADTYWEACRLGIRLGSRVRIRALGGIATDDAYISDIGQTGLSVKIGKNEFDLDWSDILELRKIEFP